MGVTNPPSAPFAPQGEYLDSTKDNEYCDSDWLHVCSMGQEVYLSSLLWKRNLILEVDFGESLNVEEQQRGHSGPLIVVYRAPKNALYKAENEAFMCYVIKTILTSPHHLFTPTTAALIWASFGQRTWT